MKPVHHTIIGCCYGIYRVVGRGAQATVNLVAWHIGYELRRAFKPRSDSLLEALDEFVKWLDLGDRVEARLEGSELLVVVEGCHVCPKRVGGYEIEGTACPVPGLLLGFIAAHAGLRIDPRQLTRNIQWGIGERCEFRIRLPPELALKLRG